MKDFHKLYGFFGYFIYQDQREEFPNVFYWAGKQTGIKVKNKASPAVLANLITFIGFEIQHIKRFIRHHKQAMKYTQTYKGLIKK